MATESKSVTYNSTYGTLPTPTREGYNFDGWYRKYNRIDMDDFMAFFNEQENLKDSNPTLVIHESDGSYSFEAQTSRGDDGVIYRYYIKYLKRGATYRFSYTGRAPSNSSTTCFITCSGTKWLMDAGYVKTAQWSNFSYSFLVEDEFILNFHLGWGGDGRAYFKNVRLECESQEDYEAKITSSTTMNQTTDHTLYAKWSKKTWDNYAADSYDSGSGTNVEPYIIKTSEQMAKLSLDSKSSNLNGVHFKLEADVNMQAHIWDGISLFNGVFDGNMHTISNVMGFGADCRGLFNQGQCTIRNLILSNSSIRTGDNTENAGAIIGNTNNSLIENCIVDNVRIESTNGRNISFLVGSNGGTIRNCLVRNSYGIDILGEGGLFVFTAYQNESGKVENCAVVNCQISFTNVDGSNNIAHTSEGGLITSTFVDCTMVTDGNVKFVKNIYGTSSDFSGFFYNTNINGGYPIPKTLVSVGGVNISSETIYNALLSKGFKN